jgi:hypothetical protein
MLELYGRPPHRNFDARFIAPLHLSSRIFMTFGAILQMSSPRGRPYQAVNETMPDGHLEQTDDCSFPLIDQLLEAAGAGIGDRIALAGAPCDWLVALLRRGFASVASINGTAPLAGEDYDVLLLADRPTLDAPGRTFSPLLRHLPPGGRAVLHRSSLASARRGREWRRLLRQGGLIVLGERLCTGGSLLVARRGAVCLAAAAA